jgi:hypothetical protein
VPNFHTVIVCVCRIEFFFWVAAADYCLVPLSVHGFIDLCEIESFRTTKMRDPKILTYNPRIY